MSEPTVESKFLEKIKQEHAELGRLVTELRAALAVRGDVTELSALVERLKTELVEHFALEEEGGYFNEVLAEAPRLRPNADRLLTQHEQLMAAIESLCTTIADASRGEDNWKQLEADGNDFIALLIDHERGENNLLLEAYQQDIGSKD